MCVCLCVLLSFPSLYVYIFHFIGLVLRYFSNNQTVNNFKKKERKIIDDRLIKYEK